jgi:hypothetical protein
MKIGTDMWMLMKEEVMATFTEYWEEMHLHWPSSFPTQMTIPEWDQEFALWRTRGEPHGIDNYRKHSRAEE